jgi:hypothetical protein
VFERTLAPVFAALQVSFVVRNHALGNNPCYPYDACIATHLGEDLDILAWEQVRKRTTICVAVGVLWLCCHVIQPFCHSCELCCMREQTMCITKVSST